MGFVGSKYTWFRGQGDGNIIWERLDRAIATVEWIEMFPATKVRHFECGSSDHKPILILPKGIPKRRRKPWRFEQMWLEDLRCKEVVFSTWERFVGGSPIDQVERKIKECQAKLKQWSCIHFENITQALTKKKKKKEGQGGGNQEWVNG